jgi:3-oxoacyl-[acyl-carrier protein] reductase
MTGRLKGKTALVTGAGRGIGAAIARRFASEGARVVVNDLTLPLAQPLANEIDGFAVAADVSNPEDVARMFEALKQAVGPVDVLVNNAGIGGSEGAAPERSQALEERRLAQATEAASGGRIATHLDVTLGLTNDEWRRMLAVHLDGTFYCSRQAISHMIEHGHGVILNMGSIMGTSGGGGAPHYAAAKAGILGLTRALAQDLASRNIRVNTLAPGWIDTDMTNSIRPEIRRMLELRTPLMRFGEADDIAHAAVYLASDEAKFVTGQVLSPNGGWYMSQ